MWRMKQIRLGGWMLAKSFINFLISAKNLTSEAENPTVQFSQLRTHPVKSDHWHNYLSTFQTEPKQIINFLAELLP